MVTSPDEIAVFLRAWKTLPACRPPDRDEDETLKVTVDLAAERRRRSRSDNNQRMNRRRSLNG